MRAPLQWVLWDVTNTLLKVRASVGEQYCKEAQRMGLNLSPVEVDAAFRQAYHHHSSRYPNYGMTHSLDGQTWWMGVVQDTFSRCRVQDPVLLETMGSNLYNNFCNAENWQVFPEAWKALESCSSRGLKLGVVSNFDKRLERVLHVCGLLSYFSFLITSEEAGTAKPDPAIFNQAVRKCGTPAAGIAYVGDDYVNDYLTSRSVGMHGFLLDRHNKHKHVPRQHRLNSLEELPSHLQLYME